MIGSIHRGAALGVLVVLSACGVPLIAQAGTINIILSNVDVSYLGSSNGGVLFDSMGGVPGGALNPATADGISTAVYEVDGSAVGTLMSGDPDDIFGDFRIINVGATLPKNVLNLNVGANGGGFGFDLFTDSGVQLRLGMTSVDLLVTNGVFFFTGEAVVLPGQNLPFGLVLDETQPVQFSYTATLPAVQAGPTTNAAMSSGAFTISGIAVPEPAAYVLACFGLVAAGFALASRPRRDALSLATVSKRLS